MIVGRIWLLFTILGILEYGCSGTWCGYNLARCYQMYYCENLKIYRGIKSYLSM